MMCESFGTLLKFEGRLTRYILYQLAIVKSRYVILFMCLMLLYIERRLTLQHFNSPGYYCLLFIITATSQLLAQLCCPHASPRDTLVPGSGIARSRMRAAGLSQVQVHEGGRAEPGADPGHLPWPEKTIQRVPQHRR